jgi:hypothetical protein
MLWRNLIGTAAGDNSIDFNGSSSYIYNGAAGTNFGTGDFTLEAWIRPDATSGYRGIMGQNYNSSGGMLYILNGQLQYYQGGAIATGGTINVDTWYHVAASRSGSTLRLFVDGTQVTSATVSFNITADDLLVGGANSSANAVPNTEFFDGEIYRPRWSNSARYTSAFTPSKSYGVDANTIALIVAYGAVPTEIDQSLSLTTSNLAAGSAP